jgi:hypothetical protein
MDIRARELADNAQWAVVERLRAIGVEPTVFRIMADDPFYGGRVDWEATAALVRASRHADAAKLADACMTLATHPDVFPVQTRPPAQPAADLSTILDDLVRR